MSRNRSRARPHAWAYMNKLDFVGIQHFKPHEILNTGATLESVNARLIQALDYLRELKGLKIKLLPNGLTTGIHKSDTHLQGLAVDVEIEGDTQMLATISKALAAGFKGIGVYWNAQKKTYRYHFDLGKTYKFWGGYKLKTADDWTYCPLIFDPKLKIEA